MYQIYLVQIFLTKSLSCLGKPDFLGGMNPLGGGGKGSGPVPAPSPVGPRHRKFGKAASIPATLPLDKMI
jgi:hypothetical protein